MEGRRPDASRYAERSRPAAARREIFPSSFQSSSSLWYASTTVASAAYSVHSLVAKGWGFAGCAAQRSAAFRSAGS